MLSHGYDTRGHCVSCGHDRGDNHRVGCGWCDGMLKREALELATLADNTAMRAGTGIGAQKLSIWATQLRAVADGSAGADIDAFTVRANIHAEIVGARADLKARRRGGIAFVADTGRYLVRGSRREWTVFHHANVAPLDYCTTLADCSAAIARDIIAHGGKNR